MSDIRFSPKQIPKCLICPSFCPILNLNHNGGWLDDNRRLKCKAKPLSWKIQNWSFKTKKLTFKYLFKAMFLCVNYVTNLNPLEHTSCRKLAFTNFKSKTKAKFYNGVSPSWVFNVRCTLLSLSSLLCKLG